MKKMLLIFVSIIGLVFITNYFINNINIVKAQSGPTVRALYKFNDWWNGSGSQAMSNWAYLNGGEQFAPWDNFYPTSGYIGLQFASSSNGDAANFITRLCYIVHTGREVQARTCVGHGINYAESSVDPACNCPDRGYDTTVMKTGVSTQYNSSYKPIKQVRLSFLASGKVTSAIVNVGNNGKSFWTTPINYQDGAAGFNNVGARLEITSGGEIIPLPIVTLTANPSTIGVGMRSQLIWNSFNANSLSIDQGIGNVTGPAGSTYVSPLVTTTYKITAWGANGQTATAQATVNVLPFPQAAITANPLIINYGETSTLTWSTSNADAVRIDQGIGSVASSGQRVVQPSGTTTYILYATNSQTGQIAVASVTVIVRSIMVQGDVYSGGDVSNLMVDSKSIVSAKNNVNIEYRDRNISKYNLIDMIAWGIAQAKMQKRLDQLKSEQATVINTNKFESTTFFLDTDQSTPLVAATSNPTNYPEGRTWWIKGNLTLKNVAFKGKGTLIVDGSLTVEGDLSYIDNSSSVGFAVGRDIFIKNSVNNLVGAFYSPVSITMEK